MYGVQAQFDGNAAFSGGGFMPSQATQIADPSFSPAKVAEIKEAKSKNRDSQPLTPLTVKQINEAFQSSDDKMNFLIDGVDVNNVKLVGMMLNKTERVTDVSFVIDDGTGRVDCYRWVNEAVDTREVGNVEDGMYVVVHGHLKGFQGKKQMMVYSIRPVTDHNQIAYHFADCIYVHCYNTRLRKQQDTVPAAHVTHSGFNTPLKGFQAPSSNQYAGQYSLDGLRGIDKSVLDYLQQPQCLAREKGVHRNELAQQLKVPVEKILEAIEALEAEGLVYSTIDEFHYKTTANG